MPKLTLPRTLFAAGAVALAALAGAGFLAQRTARAQPLSEPPGVDAWKNLGGESVRRIASSRVVGRWVDTAQSLIVRMARDSVAPDAGGRACGDDRASGPQPDTGRYGRPGATFSPSDRASSDVGTGRGPQQQPAPGARQDPPSGISLPGLPRYRGRSRPGP